MTPAQVTQKLDDHPDKPWTWQHSDVIGVLDQKQRRYVEALPHLFRLKTAKGDVVDYDPQPFQTWYHAHSPLAKWPDAPDRLVVKGRGIGYTSMTAMDFLLLVHTLGRVVVPVAGRQGTTSQEFIERCHDLIQDSVEPDMWDYDPRITSQVRIGDGRIIGIAGGNPHSIRSLRCPALAFDEFAFHEHADKLRTAARPVLSEGGQLNVISTHNGTDTEFYELVDQAGKGVNDMLLFTTPIHDPDALEPGKGVTTHVEEGKLSLVAPWLDLSELDALWREDPGGYRQENLCTVMDEELMLLSRRVVRRQTDPDLPLWSRTLGVDDVPGLAEQRLTLPTRPSDAGQDPLIVGVDFASKGHLSAYALWQWFPDEGHDGVLRQRWFDVMQGIPTPDQLDYLRCLDEEVRPRMVLIDMTGPGTGLYEDAVDELSCIVRGINFGSSVKLEKRDKWGKQVKTGQKKAACLETSRRFYDGSVWLLGEHPKADLQFRHMTSIRREDLDVRSKRDDEGHGDIFFANCLAIWGPREEKLGRWEEGEDIDLGSYEWI